MSIAQGTVNAVVSEIDQWAARSVASKKSIVACYARRLALRVSSGVLPTKLWSIRHHDQLRFDGAGLERGA